MSDQEQQKKLLAVLLVLLVGFATYRVVQLTGGEGAGRRRAGGVNQVEVALAQMEVPQLKLESLRREAATYRPGRDPFRFGPKPKPAPAVRRPTVKPPPRADKAREVKPVPVRQPARPPAPRPPQVNFTYLGSFGPSERRIAVFVKDDEIFNALAGDVLLENFIVDKIGFESADITFVGFPDSPGTRLEAGG